MTRTIPLPCIQTLLRSCAAQLDELRAALQLPPQLATIIDAAGTGLATRLLQVAGNLPRTAHHHVDEPDALVHHSLRIASKCVRAYRDRYPEPPPSDDRHGAWQQRLCAMGLSGLVCDLGLVWFIDVHAQAQRWPIHRDLVAWSQAVAAADATITCLQVSTRPGMPGRSSGARPPSLYFLSRIVTPPVLAACGWRSANDIIRTLCRTATGAPRDDLLVLLEDTQLRCAAAPPWPETLRRRTPPGQPVQTRDVIAASPAAPSGHAEQPVVPRVADNGDAATPAERSAATPSPTMHTPPDPALIALIDTCLGYLRSSPFRITVPPPTRNGPHPPRPAPPPATPPSPPLPLPLPPTPPPPPA